MNIAVIEYKNNIDEALKCFPQGTSIYLSVSAEASYNLSKRNIPFITDEELLSPQEFKQIGNENFEITEMWVYKLDEILQSQNSIFKERQFYPFRWNFYCLKILLDAVRIRRTLIERLIEKENPALIGIPAGAKPEAIHDQNLFFNQYDSLYGLLIQMVAFQKGIKVNIWEKVESKSDSHSILKRMEILFHMYKKIPLKISRIMSEFRNIVKYRRTKDNILLGILGYDIQPLRNKISDKFNFYYYKNLQCISLLYAHLNSKPISQNNGIQFIKLNNLFNAIKITGDTVVDEILNKRVQSYGEIYIPLLWRGYNYIKSVDSKKNFKAFIHCTGAANPFYGLLIHYFSIKKKPIIVIQHGAYGFALNRNYEYSDFGHNGYFFAWGDGIKEMYEDRKKGECKIISTGSHLIEEIKKNRRTMKTIKKICYVPNSGYRAYTAYYPNGQPCLDSKMFIMQTNFLMTLKPYLKKYEITYKIAAEAIESTLLGSDPMIDWIKENLPEILIESYPLMSVIHEFDLFIIDWPTTTLVQAMASGAEVLVYVGNPYHAPLGKPLELLQKRAVVGLNEDDFKNKIKAIMDKGKVISNIEDNSFLKKYGIHLDNGKSLERMVNQITKLC